MPSVEGLRAVSVGDASAFVLEQITPEIKETLKRRFSDYCFGRVRAGEDPEYYSFEQTIDQFFRLYDAKPLKTKIGLAGELVVHLLLPQGHDRLESACLYLNKEEHSLKKGFDLTFRDREDDGIWYGEVKSGEVKPPSSIISKVRERIGEAERSLHAMFTTDIERKRWDAAQLDAEAALSASDAANVRKLLRQDFKRIDNEAEEGSPLIRALLCAVVMQPARVSTIEESLGEEILQAVVSRSRFEDARILIVQQSQLETIIEFLRNPTEEAE